MAQQQLRPNQSAIWTGQRLAGDAPLYNMAMRFDIFGALDPDRFRAAFDTVVAGQPEMEAVYEGPEGHPRRAAKKAFPAPLDFSGEDDPLAAVEVWTQKRASRPFDLSVCSWDGCLIKAGVDHWVWFMNQHHIATDVWSSKVLFEAVSAAYQGSDAELSEQRRD